MATELFTGDEWIVMGRCLRECADDAHEGDTPIVSYSYQFFLDNPECFSDSDEWPAGMPAEPPIELIAGYYGL